jgi:hypothetical protein
MIAADFTSNSLAIFFMSPSQLHITLILYDHQAVISDVFQQQYNAGIRR